MLEPTGAQNVCCIWIYSQKSETCADREITIRELKSRRIQSRRQKGDNLMEREGSFSKEDNRRSREELEIAQKHLIDIIERSLPYMTEEMQRATKADLQNVNKDLRLK